MVHKTSVSNPIPVIPREPKRNDHTEGKKFQCMFSGCDFECDTSWALGKHFKLMLENNEQHRTPQQQHEHEAYKIRTAKEKKNKQQREQREKTRNEELRKELEILRNENIKLHGHTVTESDTIKTEKEVPLWSTKNFCSNCGEKRYPNNKFCSSCGVSLP
jgi:hypothetical protein